MVHVFVFHPTITFLAVFLSEQEREPSTNSTHICRRRGDLNPGHIGGRRVLSPLRHRCPPRLLSPLHRLSLGIPVKIAISARGTMERRFLSSPSHRPPRAHIFPSPQPPCGTKRPLWRCQLALFEF